MPIEEFRAIIEVHVDEIERQGVANGFKGFTDAVLALAIDSPTLDPLGEDVDGIESVDKFTGSGEAAVRDEIELEGSWRANIERRGFDGDLIT